MAVYVSSSSWVPPYKLGLINYQGFYCCTANVNFPSRPKRPPRPSFTGGQVSITYRNDKQVPTPQGNRRAFHGVITQVVSEGAGSDDGLLNRALANLSGNAFDALVAAFELPETLAMLRDAALAAIAASKKFAKGDVLGGLKELGKDHSLSRKQKARQRDSQRELKGRTISGTWLEVNFGWVPFINDLNSAVEAVSKSYEAGKVMGHTASNYQRGNKTERSRRSRGFGSDGKVASAKAGTSITVKGTIKNSQQVMLNSLGFNPLTAAWGVTPYSFFIDYFVDVGNFLGALTGTAGFTDVMACKVTSTLATGFSGKETSYIVQTITRTVLLPAAQAPSLKAAGPTVHQMANIAALLKQGMSGR